jgi:hypothetical protein
MTTPDLIVRCFHRMLQGRSHANTIIVKVLDLVGALDWYSCLFVQMWLS